MADWWNCAEVFLATLFSRNTYVTCQKINTSYADASQMASNDRTREKRQGKGGVNFLTALRGYDYIPVP